MQTPEPAAAREPRWCHEVSVHLQHDWQESGRWFRCAGVPSNDEQPAALSRKRAYRYRITHSDGCLAGQAPVDSHIVDWKHMGREHTWTVYNTAGDVTGSMTGVLVDKGTVDEEGKYVAAA